MTRLTFRQKFDSVLEISNEGRSPACNVEFGLDRDILQYGDENRRLNDIPLFSRATELIPAGTKYYIGLWPGTAKVGTAFIPDQFTVTVKYVTLGRYVVEENTLIVGIYQGQDFPPRTLEDSFERTSTILEELRRTADKLERRFGELTRLLTEKGMQNP